MSDPDQKAEQVGSPWAKTIGLPFGEELVRRWNAYERMQEEIKILFQRCSEQRTKIDILQVTILHMQDRINAQATDKR